MENNLSRDIYDLRDDCLKSFDEQYLKEIRSETLASDPINYVCAKKYKELRNSFKNYSVEQKLKTIEVFNSAVEDNLVVETDMPSIEVTLTALLDSLLDDNQKIEEEYYM